MGPKPSASPGSLGRWLPYLVPALLILGLFGGIAFGVRVFRPFLVREHQRLDPSEALFLWSGDAVTLLAFVVYCVRHTLLGKPIGATALPAAGLDRRFRVVMTGMIAAFALDLGYTLYLMDHEGRVFAAASLADGTVVRVRSHEFPFGTVYALGCRFADRQGVGHDATFFLRDDRDGGFSSLIPPAVRGSIRRRQVPFTVGVAYDPARPTRRWLLGTRWYDEDRLHLFSLVVMNAQILGIIAVAVALRNVAEGSRRLPWWHDLHAVIPLCIEVAAVVFLGLTELIHPRVTWWAGG